jgi:predicted membrane-bound spermidine synthase
VTYLRPAPAGTYAGLFLVACATLMYEVLLTRIFNITMWHHFAFMSISIAMFGMSVGALVVHAWPGFFTASRTQEHLAWSAALFAAAIPISFLTHLSIPFLPRPNFVFVYSLALTYAILALPFLFSGICVCLALTRFPRNVSRLYGTDLAGASAGCVAVIALLNVVDGPSAVLLVAATAACAALVFRSQPGLSQTAAFTGAAALAIAGIGNAFLAAHQHPALRVVWAKGSAEVAALHEVWSPLGRVRVTGDAAGQKIPYRFGMGSLYPRQTPVRELDLTLDATSLTLLTGFDGSFSGLDHLRFLVMNLAYAIKSDADVLVLGSGGGRDIISALAFGQRSVTGVEISRAVLDTVHGTFGEFTGHLERNPKVRLVHDDGRNFVRGTAQRFDIIQISAVSGVFVLLEQPLYTLEAWATFLDRLKPGGILSVSRTYAPNGAAEFYRATSLAAAALRAAGVAQPRDHLVVVRSDPSAQARSDTFGTLLIGKDRFSDSTLDHIDAVSRAAGFEVILSPRVALDPVFAQLTYAPADAKLMDVLSQDLSAPTDDRPFFFSVLRLRDLLSTDVWRNRTLWYNLEALIVLIALLAVVVVLTVTCILMPARRVAAGTPSGSLPAASVAYFSAIGFGFIFIEMAQLQMLTLFLGHPTYSLGVLLSTLLIASGIGSAMTARIGAAASTSGRVRLVALVIALFLFGFFAQPLLSSLQSMPTSLRIAAAVALVAPLGVLMGMPLPLGMKFASQQSATLTPWLWAINGATSVCGSVASIAFALSLGVSFLVWMGVAAYVVAAFVYWHLARTKSGAASRVEAGRQPAGV